LAIALLDDFRRSLVKKRALATLNFLLDGSLAVSDFVGMLLALNSEFRANCGIRGENRPALSFLSADGYATLLKFLLPLGLYHGRLGERGIL